MLFCHQCTRVLDFKIYPKFLSQKRRPQEHIDFSFFFWSCGDSTANGSVQYFFFLSILALAAIIQIRLSYISIESPFFELKKNHHHSFCCFCSGSKNV